VSRVVGEGLISQKTKDKLGILRLSPPPGLGLEEIGERFGGVYANAVKYNTFYIHHPGGASSARLYGAGDSFDPARNRYWGEGPLQRAPGAGRFCNF